MIDLGKARLRFEELGLLSADRQFILNKPFFSPIIVNFTGPETILQIYLSVTYGLIMEKKMNNFAKAKYWEDSTTILPFYWQK